MKAHAHADMQTHTTVYKQQHAPNAPHRLQITAVPPPSLRAAAPLCLFSGLSCQCLPAVLLPQVTWTQCLPPQAGHNLGCKHEYVCTTCAGECVRARLCLCEWKWLCVSMTACVSEKETRACDGHQPCGLACGGCPTTQAWLSQP